MKGVFGLFFSLGALTAFAGNEGPENITVPESGTPSIVFTESQSSRSADSFYMLEAYFYKAEYSSKINSARIEEVMRGMADFMRSHTSESFGHASLQEMKTISENESLGGDSCEIWVVSPKLLTFQDGPVSLKMVRQEYYPACWAPPSIEEIEPGKYRLIAPQPILPDSVLVGQTADVTRCGDSFRIVGRNLQFLDWRKETVTLILPDSGLRTFETKMPILENNEEMIELSRSGGFGVAWHIGEKRMTQELRTTRKSFWQSLFDEDKYNTDVVEKEVYPVFLFAARLTPFKSKGKISEGL